MATSEDIYHPEWLELEKGLGSRPQLTANVDIDVPVFNGMAEQLAAQWPPLEVDLITVDETIQATDTTPAFPVRIYTPRNKGDNLPLVVFFHGGGYISGTNPP
ncbi:hypothetical protein PMZ80_003097 [Knufia obscura]|uniref:Alpha/beta hydrolase fold-3 domain-containing protein n=2 Tax=Knufia TaxID=430999 RepID=A0AAN8EEQ6_9EURO|nr:hypothetical protein PMZ80_003097 [Knufia obscura]KAK5947910.1 hypothetical protein OHC33_011067 [Knufia fluminis]